VAILPGYFPAELVAAAGGFPVRTWGGRAATVHADAALQSYICTMAKAVLEDIQDGTMDFASGFIVPAVCDTMQNLSDLIAASGKKAFCFRAPRTSFKEEATAWLQSEVERFNTWIAGITGKKADAESLALQSDRYGSMRDTLMKMYQDRRSAPAVFPPRLFYGVIRASHIMNPDHFAEWALEISMSMPEEEHPAGAGKRIVVSGTAPLPLEFLPVFGEQGLILTDDDFMAGRRLASKPLMRSFEGPDVYEAFLGGAPCPSIVPGHEARADYLCGLVKEAEAAGVVFWQTKACENEAFDYPWVDAALKERGVKTVLVEIEQKMRTFETAANRLAAFAETL
jgi:benzoyl-CoA reductase/2-hydroxyglutaryl-CoA dehydratase subunit BcrC/BadD/HgdB